MHGHALRRSQLPLSAATYVVAQKFHNAVRMRGRWNWGSLGRSEHGVTALEYALIAGLASIALVAGAQTIGAALFEIFQSLANKPFW